MEDQREMLGLLNSSVRLWMQIPAFAPLSDILKEDRQILEFQLSHLPAPRGHETQLDMARAFILQYALLNLDARLDIRHFVLFKEFETIQVILEDCFGVRPGIEHDSVTVPYQKEAISIVVEGLFGGGSRYIDHQDLVCFFRFCFKDDGTGPSDLDRVIRYKSMFWFAYLLIDLVGTDHMNVCSRGLAYLKSKFIELLDRAIDGTIINEDSCRSFGYEGGRWDTTLFGWLQGDDRKGLALKLRRQFNMDNNSEHANRCLLAEQRKRMFKKSLSIFCGGEKVSGH
jgi:hypothetical protein